jgi:hypothetical protein
MDRFHHLTSTIGRQLLRLLTKPPYERAPEDTVNEPNQPDPAEDREAGGSDIAHPPGGDAGDQVPEQEAGEEAAAPPEGES